MDPLEAAGLGVDIFKLGYNLLTNKRDFDYQKALQQQMFEREDTAIQRRMADLKNAGINPNLAAGSAASAGSVVSRSNTNDLGSALDTVQALNSIKQQKQAVKNLQVENEILQNNRNIIAMDATMSKAALFEQLGLPYAIKALPGKYGDVKLDFRFKEGEGFNWNSNQNMPFSQLFNFNLQNQKNAANLLQKDVDWYTADKVSGMALGLFGLGNSASGWRKAFSKGGY